MRKNLDPVTRQNGRIVNTQYQSLIIRAGVRLIIVAVVHINIGHLIEWRPLHPERRNNPIRFAKRNILRFAYLMDCVRDRLAMPL
jgi:hypothetical protein